MILTFNENEYAIDRFTFTISKDEDSENLKRKDLSITLFDEDIISIIDESNSDLYELKISLGENKEDIVFEDFKFESLNVYMSNGKNNIDVRFSK